MFDFSNITELLKVEPGHGLIQSILLFMIWITSRGLKKEVINLKDSLTQAKTFYETRFEKLEGRLDVLEENRGKS